MLKQPTAGELLFSAKSFAAAMLALYVAMRVGLPRPFWAMMTAYIASHPLAGAARSKGLFRLIGTMIGSAATVCLVPGLSNAPELLSLALALWVGGCLFISLLDRTPKSYVFMLAGYTAALIGFPAVSDPSTVFETGLARVEEIGLGILAASLVHSLVLPQGIGPVLLARLDRALGDAGRWIAEALTGGTEGHGKRTRRTLAADITELRLLTTHLPFDTSHLKWTAGAIHDLQDKLALMVPLLTAIEDRLQALREAGGEGADARWRRVLDEVGAWGHAVDADPAQARPLLRAIDDATPAVHADAPWIDLLQVNLAARLRQLVETCAEAHQLRGHLKDGLGGKLPAAMDRRGHTPNVLHRDVGMALLSATAAVVALLSVCAFWIATAWPMGSAAAMMCAVFCCFFAAMDDPVPAIRGFMNYTIVSIPLSAVYLLGILPAVHSFEMLMLVTAPLLLFLGVLIARPATFGQAMAVLFGVCGTLSMQDTNTMDMVSFVNSMIGQLAGIVAAAVFTRLMRSVSAGFTARRLLKAGWSELARFGDMARPPTVVEVTARMLDRIALLTPRLAQAGPRDDFAAVDALGDLRLGLNMAHLRAVEPQLRRDGIAVRPLVRQVAAHFRERPAGPLSAEPGLLERIDGLLRQVCAADRNPRQQEAVASLVSIRRDLFPRAAPYFALEGA